MARPSATGSLGRLFPVGTIVLTVWYILHVLGALALVAYRVAAFSAGGGKVSDALPLAAQLVIVLALTAFWALIAWGMAQKRSYARMLALIDNLLIIGLAGGLAGWQLLLTLPAGLLWLALIIVFALVLWRSGRVGSLPGAGLVVGALLVAAAAQVIIAPAERTDVAGTLVTLGGAALLTLVALVIAWFLGAYEDEFVISGARDERIVTVTMIMPSVLAIGIFVYAFIAWSGWVSLSNWSGIEPDYAFRGLANYATMFANPRFQIDMRNTAFFTIVFIVACLGLGLLLAVLLDQKLPAEGLFRSIFLFPMAISFVVTGVVWRWLLNPGSSVSDVSGINLLLHRLGLTAFNFRWFIDPTVWPGIKTGQIELFVPMGMIAIVLAATWQMSGYTMAMYLAGLRGIPEELREAARVDGATELEIYRHVVLPILQPITLSAIIILGHISLKIFDLVAVMTPDGGAGFVTDVPALHMFQIIYKANRYADGAVIAVVMLLTVAVLVVPYLVYSTRTEVQQ